MADIFLKDDALKILKGKQIIFIGDSIQRNIYQDLVTLLCKGEVTSHDILKKKGEMIPEYLGDKLVNNTGQLTPGTEYREERELRLRRDGQDPPLAKFYFLTKCWSSQLKEFLVRYKEEHGSPDLILVLSCLWDINRWGSGGIAGYKTNCRDLLRHVKKHMSAKTQVIWLTSPPIAVECHGALMVEGMDKEGMRFNVMEANLMVATAAASFGYDVVDLHHMLMHQVHKRMPDGIHWTQAAVRFQLNLILTHFCLSRNIPLPRRDSSNFLQHAKRIADCALEGPVEFVKDRNENHVHDSKRKQQTTDAKEAKEALNGTEMDSRKIRVDFSITKRAHTPTPGMYMGRPTTGGRSGGGGGGYRGGDRRRDDRYRRRSPSPHYRGGRGRTRSPVYRRSPSPHHRRGGGGGFRSRSRSFSPRRREYSPRRY